MILGLDISTTIVGCALLDKSELQKTNFNGSDIVRTTRNLVMTEAWDISDKKEYSDTYIKAEAIAAELYQLSQNYDITHIYVEDYVRGVQHRFNSNMNVLLSLARFNGLVCWHCYDIFGIKPVLANVAKARNTYGISFPSRTKSAQRKKIAVEHVIEKEGTKFNWAFNRNGVNYAKGVNDRADAVVVARFGEFWERNKENEAMLDTKMKIDNLKSI